MAANSSQNNTPQTKLPWAAASYGDGDDQLKGAKCSAEERVTMAISGRWRRKRMKDLCSNLQAVLPSRTLSKLDRRGLFEEACEYIRRLQNKVEELKKRRDAYLQAVHCGCDDISMGENYSTAVSNNKGVQVVVNVYEREAAITITGARKPCCFSRIVEEIDAHDLDVQMAQFCEGNFIVLLYFQVKLKTWDCSPLEMQISLESRLKAIY